jgi:hypothetical protein
LGVIEENEDTISQKNKGKKVKILNFSSKKVVYEPVKRVVHSIAHSSQFSPKIKRRVLAHELGFDIKDGGKSKFCKFEVSRVTSIGRH